MPVLGAGLFTTFQCCFLGPLSACLGPVLAPCGGPGDGPDAPGHVHRLGRSDRPHRTRRRPRNLRQSHCFHNFFFTEYFFSRRFALPGMVIIMF